MPPIDRDHHRPDRRSFAGDENRRTHHRFETSLLVRFTSSMLDFDGAADLDTGQVANISRGGLFVRSEYLEPPGTPVRLILMLPRTGETTRLDGVVAWINDDPPGMGVRLSGALDEETIERFVG